MPVCLRAAHHAKHTAWKDKLRFRRMYSVIDIIWNETIQLNHIFSTLPHGPWRQRAGIQMHGLLLICRPWRDGRLSWPWLIGHIGDCQSGTGQQGKFEGWDRGSTTTVLRRRVKSHRTAGKVWRLRQGFYNHCAPPPCEVLISSFLKQRKK